MLDKLLTDINEKSEWAITVNGLAGVEDDSAKKYLAYINEHRENIGKAYHALYPVLKNCMFDAEFFKMRIIEHDLSKYTEEEFEGYRQAYYTREGETKDEAMADRAWVSHYMNNSHHPEYYTARGNVMPITDIMEMVIDWTSMSIKFKGSPYDYYKENKRPRFIKENNTNLVKILDEIFVKLEPILKTLFPESHKDK